MTGATASAVRDPARLAALRETGLLDSDAEESFDRFTRLARDLIGVEVTLVSLVDANRQYFKSRHGSLDGSEGKRETPLSHSFCRLAVESGEQLVIDDARTDPRVQDNPAVRDDGVMAYAGVPLTLPDGHTLGTFCALSSIPRAWTERELRVLSSLAAAVVAEIELRRALTAASLRDPLTGLPNRLAFQALLEHELARRGGASPELAVISFGIDDFRLVNESLGHLAGDDMLRAVARRLSAGLREGEAVCRFSGDQFLLLGCGVTGAAAARRLAERARSVVSREPVTLEGSAYPVSVTAGIARPGAPARTGAELIGEADAAMREAKERGRGSLDRGRAARFAAADSQLRLQAALANALAGGHVEVHYQPIVSLLTGELVAHEALARWTDPVLGVVRPDRFIPAAERSGRIAALGEGVLREACRELARRQSERADAAVTVNVSPQQLQEPGAADVVRRAVEDAGIPPAALVLEMTERALIEDTPALRRTLAALDELGVLLALDDFGVGYSALSYLRRFPLDILKIDRSFVEGMEEDRRAERLVRAIAHMGTALGLQVIAEGIETPAQALLLREAGCGLGQGYHFGRPQPAAALSSGPGSAAANRRPAA